MVLSEIGTNNHLNCQACLLLSMNPVSRISCIEGALVSFINYVVKLEIGAGKFGKFGDLGKLIYYVVTEEREGVGDENRRKIGVSLLRSNCTLP